MYYKNIILNIEKEEKEKQEQEQSMSEVQSNNSIIKKDESIFDTKEYYNYLIGENVSECIDTENERKHKKMKEQLELYL